MSNKNREAVEGLFPALCDALSKRIKDGTATAADLSVARMLLRDNGVTAVPVKDSPLGNLIDEMPDFDGDGLPTH